MGLSFLWHSCGNGKSPFELAVNLAQFPKNGEKKNGYHEQQELHAHRFLRISADRSCADQPEKYRRRASPESGPRLPSAFGCSLVVWRVAESYHEKRDAAHNSPQF